MALETGSRLGPYEIIAPAGTGGMGEVYKARDTRLGRTVAIKVLSQDRSGAAQRQRLLQEARAVSALNHPNIVTLFDVGQQDGSDYLVMEFVPGATLDKLIPPGGMKLADVLRIGVAASDAIANAHAGGFLHRDLKPSNIMACENGAVKVLDFGLAKTAGLERRGAADATLTMPEGLMSMEGSVAGTPAYMSPEQAEGKKLDTRSDVFSFGAVLYEMVTGRRAFPGDSAASILAAVLREQPRAAHELSPGLPRDLERLIERCLRKDPARRMASMHDVRVELEDIRDAAPEPAATAATVAAPVAKRPLVRRAAPIAAAAVAGIALGMLFSGPGGFGGPGGPGGKGGPRRIASPVPLTSYPGDEVDPYFSPDGNQVAFAWSGAMSDNLDIYVKTPGPGAPLRLTTDPGADRFPAWAPDAKWIYFLRFPDGDRTYLYRVPPTGGAESRIGPTPCVTDLTWTPDGESLICHGTDKAGHGAFVVPRDGGEARVLLAGAHIPRVSPDGKQLLYTPDDGTSDLHTVALAPGPRVSGPPVRISSENATFVAAEWLPNSPEILAAMGAGMADSRLYRFLYRPDAPKPMLIPFAAPGTISLAVSRDGRKIAWSVQPRVRHIWSLEGADVSLHPISSTQIDYNPTYSPDGARIAFESTRSGSQQVWTAAADGTNPAALTSGGRSNGSPAWSPDGRWIVFDRRTEDGQTAIFAVDSSGGKPRQLTTGAAAVIPSFSRDGKWVYARATGRGIVRVPFEGGPHAVAGAAAFGDLPCDAPRESADGKSVICSPYGGGALFEVPIAGGAPRNLSASVSARAFQVETDGIWFMYQAQESRGPEIVAGHLDLSGKPRQIRRFPGVLATGFSVSPDRKRFLFAKSEEPGADIQILEDFR